jgi:hypothetical protein
MKYFDGALIYIGSETFSPRGGRKFWVELFMGRAQTPFFSERSIPSCFETPESRSTLLEGFSCYWGQIGGGSNYWVHPVFHAGRNLSSLRVSTSYGQDFMLLFIYGSLARLGRLISCLLDLARELSPFCY